jgi:hypothetical protein
MFITPPCISSVGMQRLGTSVAGSRQNRQWSRKSRVVTSIGLWCVLALTFLHLDSRLSIAHPYCSQITPNAFCAQPGCTPSIQWMGSCLTGPRYFRCCWDCSGTEDDDCSDNWQECECGSTGGGCDCLLGGTMISMADGTTKPVEKIGVGDLVLAVDIFSGQTTASVVEAVHTPYVADQHYIINGKTRVTGYHPLLQGQVWSTAAALNPGDELSGPGGQRIFVRSVDVVHEGAIVYNFQVAGRTYIADGIVVHNKEECLEYVQYCGWCPPD